MAVINSIRPILVLKFSRKFSLSCATQGAEIQGRFLNKLLSSTIESKIQKSRDASRAFKVLDKKRVPVLEKLYMRNISETLAFGDFPEIENKSLEITRVSVKDTRLVTVFWTASGNEDIGELQITLNKISGKVRNHLIYGCMMGGVPVIEFKKDLLACQMAEVQMALHKLSIENLKLESEKANLTSLPELDEPDVSFPPMRNDTFGYNHSRVVSRIKESKRKFFPLTVTSPPTTEEIAMSSQSDSQNLLEYQHAVMQKKELKKFVRLYKQSRLSSSNRREHLEASIPLNNGYYEDSSTYEDSSDAQASFVEWEDTAADDNVEYPVDFEDELDEYDKK